MDDFDSRPIRQLDWWMLAGLLLAICGFHLCTRPLNIAVNSDWAIYLEGAKSLADGAGYRFVAHEGAPAINLYPPLQSAYLSLFWQLNPRFPDNLGLLNYGMLAIGLGFNGLLFLYLRRTGIPLLGVCLIMIVWATSPAWFNLMNSFVSDVLFGLLWLALVMVWPQSPEAGFPGRWLAAGVIAAAMFLTRMAALAPVLASMAAVVFLFRRRAWRALAMFGLPVSLAVILWKCMAGTQGSYLDFLQSRFGQAAGLAGYLSFCFGNAMEYVSGLPFQQALFPVLPHLQVASWTLGAGPASILLVALLLVTAGSAWLIVRGIRQESCTERILGFAVLAYLLQLMAWPYALGPRCVFAVMPFLLAWAWRGVVTLPVAPTRRPVLVALAAGVLVFNFAGNVILLRQELRAESPARCQNALREIAGWMKTNLPPDAKIAVSWMQPYPYLHAETGLRLVEDYYSAKFAFAPISHAAQGWARADYLFADNRSWYWAEFAKSTRQFPALLQEVARSHYGDFRLYRIDPVLQEGYLDSANDSPRCRLRPTALDSGKE